MKEVLNSLSFLPNFVSFYILFFFYLLQELYSYVFTIYEKEKQKVVKLIPLLLLQLLIMLVQKLRGAQNIF